MVDKNEIMESISEDIVGWWAKASWQVGLPEKLSLQDILNPSVSVEDSSQDNEIEHDGVLSISTTQKSEPKGRSQAGYSPKKNDAIKKVSIPPFLAYVQPRGPQAPLVRRVDTAALLLFVSLRLAKLDSIEEAGKLASPWAHSNKIAYPAGVAQKTTVSKSDCLLADNVTVESKCIIKESVIGANCHIKTGVRLTRCVLFDGAVIGEHCQLTGCIIGRSHVGKQSVLIDCEVQEGNVIADETEAKNEKFMVFEGLEASEAEEEGEPNETDMLIE